MRIQTYGGITIRYRRDPVPYCGVYRLRKPIPPYNKRTEVLNTFRKKSFDRSDIQYSKKRYIDMVDV